MEPTLYLFHSIVVDGSYSLIMDQSVMIGQLVVAHRHQVLLFRTSKTIIIIRLDG